MRCRLELRREWRSSDTMLVLPGLRLTVNNFNCVRHDDGHVFRGELWCRPRVHGRGSATGHVHL